MCCHYDPMHAHSFSSVLFWAYRELLLFYHGLRLLIDGKSFREPHRPKWFCTSGRDYPGDLFEPSMTSLTILVGHIQRAANVLRVLIECKAYRMYIMQGLQPNDSDYQIKVEEGAHALAQPARVLHAALKACKDLAADRRTYQFHALEMRHGTGIYDPKQFSPEPCPPTPDESHHSTSQAPHGSEPHLPHTSSAAPRDIFSILSDIQDGAGFGATVAATLATPENSYAISLLKDGLAEEPEGKQSYRKSLEWIRTSGNPKDPHCCPVHCEAGFLSLCYWAQQTQIPAGVEKQVDPEIWKLLVRPGSAHAPGIY